MRVSRPRRPPLPKRSQPLERQRPRARAPPPAIGAPVHALSRPRQAAQLRGHLVLFDMQLLGVPVARPQPFELAGEVGEHLGVIADPAPDNVTFWTSRTGWTSLKTSAFRSEEAAAQ